MNSKNLPQVTIYTDGACVPNPGPGGWSVILVFKNQTGDIIQKEYSGGEPSTTSIRMEMQAAINALRYLKQSCSVTLFSDSRYLVKGVNDWLSSWKARGWVLSNGSELKNADLWKELDSLLQNHQIEWCWIRGHADNPMNQKADALARSQIAYPKLPSADDSGYHLFIRATCHKGIGGWGAVLRSNEKTLIFSGVEENTTPNKIEIHGVIEGLLQVPRNARVYIYTNNNYLYAAMVSDILRWKKQGWQTNQGVGIKNRDLWEQLLNIQEEKTVSWHLLKGHDIPEESNKAKDIAKKELAGKLINADPSEKAFMQNPSDELSKKLLQWGNEIKAIAVTGLSFCAEVQDESRYHDELRYKEFYRIASEILASINGDLLFDPKIAEEVNHLLISELHNGVAGYVTPKVSVAAAIFNDNGQILLVKPKNDDEWCLPGGWAEECLTPAENAQREVLEETNLKVSAKTLLGVFDSRYHPFRTTVATYTLLFYCILLDGDLKPLSVELDESEFFSEINLPPLIIGSKRQVEIAFDYRKSKYFISYFDN
jgi:ribonuclease HI